MTTDSNRVVLSQPTPAERAIFAARIYGLTIWVWSERAERFIERDTNDLPAHSRVNKGTAI